MRIAIPIHNFEPGGVERVALRLADHWQTEGEHVTIVLGRNEGRCKHEAPPLDYRTISTPSPIARRKTLWMIWNLYRFLSEERVDVLFCPGNTYAIVCVAMRILLGARCPPVLVKVSNPLDRADLPAVKRGLRRPWLRIQGALLDRFVALAEPMLPEIVRELGIDSGKATVIADPALTECDLKQLAQCKLDREPGPKCHFISVGRLVPQKNHALLIDAFAWYSRPEDQLTIAGDGPEWRELERLIQAHGLQDRVALVGHSHDIPALLAQADVFVLSSNYEGVPAAIIEAIAAGIPIAATNCCVSMDWLMRHGAFGVTARPNDLQALGVAMNAARHLTPVHQEMVEFASQFTVERASGAYLAVMKTLCGTIPGDNAALGQSGAEPVGTGAAA